MENRSSVQRGSDQSKVTIYDVASEAGVAISTVSRVLNNSEDVSDKTRNRVLKAIDELQFRPDRMAKTLAQQQTHVLAVAIPTFTTPFHNELLKGIRYCLRERSYDFDLLLCDLGSTDPHDELVGFLQRGAVDGLLVAGVTPDKKAAQELRAWHSPVVLIGSSQEDLDSFYWDDVNGAKSAVNHLLEQGHRRIGMIRTHTESPLQNRRVQGYREALDEAGIPYDANIVRGGKTEKHAGFSEEAGYEAMQRLLSIDPPVTAVFASSDVQAIGAWKAIRDAGKSVPENIAVVGYDDIKTSQFIGLSSVAQNMHDVGEEATQRLLFRLEHPDHQQRLSVLVTPTLQIRQSSVGPVRRLE